MVEWITRTPVTSNLLNDVTSQRLVHNQWDSAVHHKLCSNKLCSLQINCDLNCDACNTCRPAGVAKSAQGALPKRRDLFKALFKALKCLILLP